VIDSAMEVTHPRPGAAVVALRGEHDLVSSDETDELFSQLIAANDRVIVDVTEALFIDSSFIHNLVKADRLARARGTLFRLQMGTLPHVRRALEISGVLDHLDVVHSRDAAIR
jgi:anti-anti-sigma factor